MAPNSTETPVYSLETQLIGLLTLPCWSLPSALHAVFFGGTRSGEAPRKAGSHAGIERRSLVKVQAGQGVADADKREVPGEGGEQAAHRGDAV